MEDLETYQTPLARSGARLFTGEIDAQGLIDAEIAADMRARKWRTYFLRQSVISYLPTPEG